MLDNDGDGYIKCDELQTSVKDQLGDDKKLIRNLEKMFKLFGNQHD